MRKILLFFTLVILIPFLSKAAGLRENLFFENKVSVLIPNDFYEADIKSVAERFPDEANRPQIVLTDADGVALVSMSLVKNVGDRQTIIHFFRDIKENLRASYPEHRIITSDVIRGRTLAFVEVLIPNQQGEMMYNVMAFRYIGDSFFSFNFSCPKDDMQKYQDNFREVAKSIKEVRKN
ncbi:MAG: hypothetical protein SFT90_07665 [Rickettsiales bacterium]|nr:hypothetical protein [Rickettsiales bacterium]